MIRIAIPDDAPPVLATSAAWRELEGRAELDYYDTLPGSEERLAERISQSEAVLNVRSSSKFTERVMERAPRLRLISVWGTGTDHVDLAAARRRNITVTNTPDVSAFSVAEHALALLLATARRIPQADAATRRGEWPRGQGVELHGKTCGVIGLGAIGRRFAALALGIGMRVIAWTMHPQPLPGVELVEPDELFRTSDVVSVHLRLSPDTEGFIGPRQFALMRKNAILINTARGDLVDETALALALANRKIGGAGIDVLPVEPPRDGNILLDLDLPNLIVTPHIAWASQSAMTKLAAQLTGNIEAFVAERPRNVVV